MARYRGSVCKLCRREGMKLFLKGARCNTEKCSFTKRPFPPGVHGKMRKKHSYYALQLREKQKVKRLYGMQEKQFKRFFNLAAKAKGVVGENLIQLLERRLDNVIYRSLFASSRSQGRQIVLHGHLKINGKKINIPSYLVKENDRIEIQGNDAFTKLLKDIAESNSKERSTPDWLVSDQNDLSIKISKLPSREHLTLPVKEQFIVELYSK